MIVVDANYFIRYLLEVKTPADQIMFDAARTLFRLAEAGHESFVTSEAVVAEVVFILSSKRHTNLPRLETAALVRPILGLRGCAMPHKPRVMRALDLWIVDERISFVDALMAAYALDLDVPFATFDRLLSRVSGITVWSAGLGDTDLEQTTED